ncbi:ABC transporter permease [Aphanothece hegewaldii CCALA 016]|uniref:ABC transporter permease n=1 Tax=Aphanothece hegewaldii CCALA 016 TaxID=2107694 RepID=A0A2T1M0Q3_9CHRO|nr:efflux RND transporter permease subunit [Aphanothece hegewaldii]PSF38175.1 ABC transporter permease [Aphanothece hegewaldii CCALA 016]
MSFNLSTWSIKNPIPILVSFLVLALAGWFSFISLGIDRNPNIDVPAVIITVTQPGAGPVELETQVTKKIEDAVAGLGNIDQISSNVAESSSTTTVNFVLGTDSNQATNDVRNAVAQIRQDLPQDINEPIVKRLEFSGGSVITYAISSDKRSVEELSDLVDRRISRVLANVQGVAQVDRIGGVDREIRVDLDPSRLLAYGITATQVNEQIRNFNINLPGGRSEVGGSEQTVRTLGSAKTVADLKNYRIVLPNGDNVPLENLGKVEDSFADPRSSAYFNGKPVVGFSVLRSTGSTLVTVEEEVRKAIANLEQSLPDDLKFNLVFTRAKDIQESYQGTLNDLISGCILTVIVVGLFLRDWRMTLITAIALPLSIIPTFWVMQAFGYTLNGMTLLGLALAIGNLVDDAVCMVENIDTHLLEGKTPYQAAIDASSEIGLAVLASAATIIAVFLPVAFMGGIPGQFFKPFGVTVSVSTIFSSLVAVTITPMVSAYVLKPKRVQNLDQNTYTSGWGIYSRLLKWALHHRITTLIIAIAFFIGSLQLIPFIPQGLFSNPDTGLSTVSVDLPPGSTLADTTKVVQETTQLLRNNSEVSSVLANIGGSKVNTATVYVNLIPKDERNISQQEFEEKMRLEFREIPGARVSFRSQGAGGGSKDVSIVLKSENGELLEQTANTIERQMRSVPGLVEVTSSISLVKPEIIITPDPIRAADQNVSVQAIARTASLALIGDNDSNLAKFNLSDRQIPIRVKIASIERSEIDTLKNLRVPSSDGILVPLNSVANISLGSGPAEIERFNRSRRVELGANLEGLSLGQALTKIRALPAMNPLPAEVTEEPFGEAKIMRDIFSRFLGALGLAVLGIYGVLVLLYNNFLYPVAILAALPLSIGGAFLGLLIAQKELGLFALIGIVLLMGLVTKNAILLVDFALAALQEGKSQYKATLEAGISRLRPIMMTSVSTIIGMIPIALEWGADGETRSPMAIAVIGGFTTSTLLTLIVVPVIFTYIDTFYQRLKNMFVKKGKKEVREYSELN